MYIYIYIYIYINDVLPFTGHTYRADTYQAGDDSFRIMITIEMADAGVAIKNSNHAISFGAKMGSPMIFQSLLFYAGRTLTEIIDVSLTPFVNSSQNVTSIG